MQAGEELALAQALADERAGDTEEVLAIAEQAEAQAASEATKLRAELSAMSLRAKQVRASRMEYSVLTLRHARLVAIMENTEVKRKALKCSRIQLKHCYHRKAAVRALKVVFQAKSV